MFELSIASKYLLPRWRQLSVSIISLISIVVIALVVWLILVFFSVTSGLEKIWINKLIALTSPIRITPTESYYQSYYYLSDSFSQDSDYTLKSLEEKLLSEKSDPYDPEFDEEIQSTLQKDLNSDGSLKDLVKIAFNTIYSLKSYGKITAEPYEMTFANIRLRLLRGIGTNGVDQKNEPMQSFLTQAVYLGSLDGKNPHLTSTLLPFSKEDLLNTHSMLKVSKDNEDHPKKIQISETQGEKRSRSFFEHLQLAGNFSEENFETLLSTVNKRNIENPYWIYSKTNPEGELEYQLPKDPYLGDGILLPKSFKEGGVLLGDRGYLSYLTPTTSTVQEQRAPIFVAGFYDPGIVPIGGKYVLASKELTSFVRSSHNQEDTNLSNGINVRISDLGKVDSLKKELSQAFEKAGIAPYFKIETFREYEFAKDLLQQLRSEKNIFSLIAAVIIIVACSNIISMLIILVNDKRQEIGILRSMGATSLNIATIFGLCGMIMGLIGSLIGTVLALLTLKNIQFLIDLISRAQGFQAFNPLFFGNTLPNEISREALIFVLVSTVIASLVAGLIPAIKASALKPAAILRSEG